MGDPGYHPDVMVSSTFADLRQHREAVVESLTRLGFFANAMEFDSAKPGKDVIDSSIEKVDQAQAFVGILSHNYGGVPKDRDRNPDRLSITELEYRRALERGIPVYMFLMRADHPVIAAAVEANRTNRTKLSVFRRNSIERAICGEFSSVDELRSLVLQSMAELRENIRRDQSIGRVEPDDGDGAPEDGIPRAPALYAVPDYIGGHEFVGRGAELGWLDQWVVSDRPLLVIEAIGGMGKSMLTWRWIQDRARAVRPDLAGIFWYSFYEGGAEMSAFAARALAYATGRPLKEFRGKKTTALTEDLLAALRGRRWLLVLDGLERVLVAYHRFDAAQRLDEDVESDRDHRLCIKPADAELLRRLVGAARSKVLVTSRLFPADLTNRTGQPLPGVSRHTLQGLHRDDALALLRRLGVRGDQTRVQRYLEENFGNHPLLVGVVAGLVGDYRRDPGNFDRWADDPQGGAALHLAELDLSQRRTHILAAALDGLEPGARQLLSRIAALSDAVPFDTVAALNPFLPAPPTAVPEPGDLKLGEARLKRRLKRVRTEDSRTAIEQELENLPTAHQMQEAAYDAYVRLKEEYLRSTEYSNAVPRMVDALRDLERRGLLQWDRRRNAYDLHPVVRGYAFDLLEDDERAAVGNLIVDHFQSQPGDRYEEVRTLADIQHSINIFRALTYAGRWDDAVSYWGGDFNQALMLSLEAYHETLSLLGPLFPEGLGQPPRLRSARVQSYVCNETGIALSALNRHDDAILIILRSLRISLDEKNFDNIWVNLSNLAIDFRALGAVGRAHGARQLALETAEAIEIGDAISISQLDLTTSYAETGQFIEAEAPYQAFRARPTPIPRAMYRAGDAERILARLRFYQGCLTHDILDEALGVAREGHNRFGLRYLYYIWGHWALQRDEADEAARAAEQAVEMAREVGLLDGGYEALLARTRVRQGNPAAAREILERLVEIDQPLDLELAEIYLELDEPEKAKEHVPKAYERAWADGPPYVMWWPLQRCRAVLAALGEPEPVLPPFDPAKVEPIPYEDEIKALIEEFKAKKT